MWAVPRLFFRTCSTKLEGAPGDSRESRSHALGTGHASPDELFRGSGPHPFDGRTAQLGHHRTVCHCRPRCRNLGLCPAAWTQDRQVHIQGVSRRSLHSLCGFVQNLHLDAAIQKDVWHPLADVGKVIHDVSGKPCTRWKAWKSLEKRLREALD